LKHIWGRICEITWELRELHGNMIATHWEEGKKQKVPFPSKRKKLDLS
jgi:hypothetical protein